MRNMQIRVERPPELRGSEDEKLQLLYTYLFRLSENLGVALNREGTAMQSVSGAGAGDALRAQLIYAEDTLRGELQSGIAAVSGALSEHKKEPVYPISVE